MLRILPLVMREEIFALKGGTAINFFWRDLPRLSVDIDLVYVPIQDRILSLSRLSNKCNLTAVSFLRNSGGL